MPTDPTLVAALRDANAAQLREDAADYAAAADRIARTWTDFGQVVPDGIAAQVAAHRRMAGLALAVARMQELAEREASKVGYNPREVRWTVDSDGDTHWHDAHMYSEVPRTLPAALSALLEDAP